MNRREKILAAVTGLFVVCLLIYILVDQLILTPAGKWDTKAEDLTKEITKLQHEIGKKHKYVRRLREVASRSLGFDERQVSNDLDRQLKRLLNQSGLSDQNQSLSPASGTPVGGVYKEIGRAGHVSGTLSNAIDFLYLVKREPALHRLDNLVITPRQGGRADLQFKYSTLVLLPLKEREFRFPTTTTAPAPPRKVDLNGQKRLRYNVIVARDLFRPYVKRPVIAIVPRRPAPTPPRPAPPRPAPPPPRAPARAGRFKVVDLSTWADQPEVVVRDISTGQIRIYKPGALLASGKVVMIDYRQLPKPDNPFLLSPSRVILQIGPDFWAVELGQSLSNKRRLKPEQLPETLRVGAAKPPEPEAGAGDKDKKQT